FRLEVSAICARTDAGEIATYPIGENIHRERILDASRIPAPISPALAAEARRMGEALAEGLGVVGLLAVEIFVGKDDRLFFNEIAPRPHNSGHYTWEACAVSQFEQHLRAVCALPLGRPEQLRPAAMVNLLGEDIGNGEGLSALPEALAEGAVSLHLYGKREARPRRKMGHLTALAEDSAEALALARRAREILTRRG
ncbi:MAG: ATP-grasp domain-containing protein, partial [Gemmatimonadota bacterium]|nr:ATP-grasp domain-containing protein [Gemmatimonadota bacterium]